MYILYYNLVKGSYNLDRVTLLMEKNAFKPIVKALSPVIGHVIQLINYIITCNEHGIKSSVISFSFPININNFKLEIPLNPYSKSKILYFKSVGV